MLITATPVDKALWYIESHSDSALSLDEIAENANVSKYHLLRAFSAATGLSIMRYLRGRRLTQAARRLASGADDILAVAIDSGYSSHEAFTRAFREQFGATPEAVREQGDLQNIPLLEAIVKNSKQLDHIDPTRLEDGKLLLIAGLVERYPTLQAGAQIPAQWQRFERYLGSIPGQIGQMTYGVCYNTDDDENMDYLCGVEVADFSALPREFGRLRIPPQRYAVFFHSEHISAVRSTWNAIWNGWLPQSGYEAADAPLFERYDQRFDPRSGGGGVELWVPIKR
jgi:AraC family transcriptional regulator